MIVTMKVDSRQKQNLAAFEALKLGLDFTSHADNTFDVTVSRMDKLDQLISSIGHVEILAKQNYVPIERYS